MNKRVALAGLAILVLWFPCPAVQAADKSATPAGLRYRPTGPSRIPLLACPKTMITYTLQTGDTCQSMAQNQAKFHFTSAQQVEQINKPLSGFTCAKAKAKQIICHPT